MAGTNGRHIFHRLCFRLCRTLLIFFSEWPCYNAVFPTKGDVRSSENDTLPIDFVSRTGSRSVGRNKNTALFHTTTRLRAKWYGYRRWLKILIKVD
jgi:hypothetical protein